MMWAFSQLVRGIVVATLASSQPANSQTNERTDNGQKANWQAPQSARSVKNPIPSNQQILDEGLELYRRNCLTCHGVEGKGNGPAIEYIEKRPPDVTLPETQQRLTDGEIFWKVTEGRNPMPPFKKKLSDEQRWKIVHYVRELGRK